MARLVCFMAWLLLGLTSLSLAQAPSVELGGPCALATNLTPKFPPEYYIEQGVKYFQTMQSNVPVRVQPKYAITVIRWEWEPWLLLTGYKRNMMIVSDALLKLYATDYYLLDCRYFDVQPFCRCHVVFNYSGTTCPIYEEFTFNDAGEITFIEAWSDFESLLPMGPGPDSIWDESDYWALNDANRLATKLPGLGSHNGRIALGTPCMDDAAATDHDIAKFVKRMRRPLFFWIKQLFAHFEELEGGCDAPTGDVYPYYTPKSN